MSDLVTEETHRVAMRAANGAVMYGADYRAMKIGLDAAAPLIVAAELDAVVDEIRAGSYPHLYRLASNLADRAAELRGGAS